MFSVKELAQKLSRALDENFNITNEGDVLQVVSCLEAINITQESFQGVSVRSQIENTRIIKDLQALRQNKANDQALAKRIKNLLKKWKQRLATASRPSSPQQMSQGSCDTQFMTSQSQSPPVSQPSNHQLRVVNGPTSFSNLLPKQQQSMNHHNGPVIKSMTSPAPPLVSHLNGTNSSQESLLGKRKLTTEPFVDDSSNHRKKMMKKSGPSAISSSPSLQPFTNHNNHHISPPIPTVPAQQPPVAVPKQRGRKKGSKGIDSMLNGNIPDFQAEIKQKIALSAGKRNKTTVELQQMLELHQNSAISWKNGDVDSSSLDRGISAFSSPPEMLQSDELKRNIKQEIEVKEESHESLQKPIVSSTPRSLNIEEEIAKLRAQLPPIDFEAAALDSFEEYSILDKQGEPIECTCTFREVITYVGDEEATAGVPDPPMTVFKNGGDVKQEPDESDDDETDDFCAVDDDDVKLPIIPSRGAVKSIFDPEYDANENLIEEMVRRKPTSKVIEVKIDKEAVKPSRIEPTLLIQPEPTQQVERVPIVNYECDEDPMCPARAHFQRDPVSMKDVERLHNRYLDGINGFYNGIPEEKPAQDYSKDLENIDYEKHRLWKRVVPRYDFLTCDRIPKTNNSSKPLSLPPPPPEADENGKPFDGAKMKSDIEFREWHEVMNVRSFDDEVLTILPYVIID